MYTNEQKKALIKKHTPHSSFFINAIKAFVFGGIICALGEALFIIFSSDIIFNLSFDEKTSYTLVTYFFILFAISSFTFTTPTAISVPITIPPSTSVG